MQLLCKEPSHGYIEINNKNVSTNGTFEFGTGFDIYDDLNVREKQQLIVQII